MKGKEPVFGRLAVVTSLRRAGVVIGSTALFAFAAGNLVTGFDGKVTIEPDQADPTRPVVFFRIVLPKDPDAE